MPEPTAIFMSIPQYNVIFNSIVQWFRFGAYNLEKEECLLPFLINNQLYEYYVLLKLLNEIPKTISNCELIECKPFKYPMPSKSLYKNTVYNNTFKFGTPSKNITVFYQPVIYGQEYSSDQTKNNAIELYRSTTFKFPNAFIDSEDNGSKFSYYTPDYVIV